jgi:hypothetical protein
MRSWQDGQEWDSRTLSELRWSTLRIWCRACRHSRVFFPVDLKDYIGERERWSAVLPKFRCLNCDEKQASGEVTPLPRN